MKKNRIAVTGANGFLGKHLVNLLKKRKDVELVLFDKNKNCLFDRPSLESFLRDVDSVIHLAGANRDSDSNLIKINVLGTIGLLEAMVKYSPKAKLIFSSSFQAYDEKNAYGLSKKLAEDVIRSFSRIYNTKSIILRISNIYGEGGRAFYNSVIATFEYLIKNKKTITINGTGEQGRDYIHVEDVVDAIGRAIEYVPISSCELFDICSGKQTSLNEIIGCLKNNVFNKINIQYNKDALEEDQNIQKNYKKAEHAFGWHPKIKIREGLALMFKKYET